jgi:hypothetical protein
MHSLEPLCHSFGITILATRTDLGATRDRVPCYVGPFD